MKKLRTLQSLYLSLALSAPLSHAVEFNQVQSHQSSIRFSYQQMGVSMDGKFKKFSSQLAFDPAQPAKAKAAFDIDLASIDTGAAESDEEVAGKSWFNTSRFPKASFASSGVKALGSNRYEVSGRLTIKGRSKDIVVPATFTQQGNSGVFAGSFTVRRADFAIGEGPWAKFDIVANDVNVTFRIAANAVK